MQPDFDKTAAAMVAGTEKAIAAAVAPLLRRIETLEARPLPEAIKGDPGESVKGDTGVGVAGAVIDRAGVLVLTLSDGTTRDLGTVVGKDGQDADMAALERRIDERVDEKVAAIPVPKDGRDGFNLDDFDVEAGEDGRTVTLKFEQGDTRHCYELVFPVTIYRDVFKAGETYQAGDAVTWGGSLWIAQRETDAKPDSPESGWRLAVKKGRDGKDAKST